MEGESEWDHSDLTGDQDLSQHDFIRVDYDQLGKSCLTASLLFLSLSSISFLWIFIVFSL